MSGKNFQYRVNKIIIPFFRHKPIKQITFSDLLRLNQELSARNLSSVTISQYFQDLRKIFSYADSLELIQKIPRFPKIRKKSIPRGGFDVAEYRKLVNVSRQLSKKLETIKKRNHRFTAGGVYAQTDSVPEEMEHLIRFMVNAFVRPTDVFQMKNKHVKIIKGEFHYLRLELPETKRHTQQIVTLRPAVRIYEHLSKNAQKNGYGKQEDYVFFPSIKNRETAGRIISMHFNKILVAAELKQGGKGQSRSLYSLRHTSIMFRLLYGQGIDLLTLARNSRTSVLMIEKFYASELQSEMNVGVLQSRRGVSSVINQI